MRSAAATRFGILHRPTNNFLGEFPTREEAEACVTEFSDAEQFEIVDFEELACVCAEINTRHCPVHGQIAAIVNREQPN